MAKRRTHEPGEWVTIIKAAGFDYGVYGSWFVILFEGREVPDGPGVDLPRSGRVSIADLATEMERAEAFRKSKAA